MRHREQQDICRRRAAYHAYVHVAQLGKRAVCEHRQHEDEHEGVAVVEPVRLLKPVPYDVDARHDKAEDEHADESARGDLFASADLARGKERGHRQRGEHTAVDERQTVRAHGVIRCGEQTGEQVEQIEL